MGSAVKLANDEGIRFFAVVDALDEAVAARPDLLASPVGFIVGALVSAANSDSDAAWDQIAGLSDLSAYFVRYVRTGEGSTDAIIGSLLPS